MPSRFLSFAALIGLASLSACSQSPIFPSDPAVAESIAAAARGELPVPGGEATGSVAVKINLESGFDRALRASVENHPSFAAALRRAEEARMGLAAAASVERPQVSASGTLGGIAEDLGGANSTTVGAGVDLTLSKLVYDGGEAAAGIGAAEARSLAAAAEVAVAGNDTALAAATAWVDLWRARAQGAELEARFADLEPLAAQLGKLTESGMIDRTAVLTVERSVIGLRLEREQIGAELRDAEARFRRHFGAVPATLAKPAGPLALAAIEREEAALGLAPRLASAAAGIVAIDLQLAAAEARMKPKVSLRTGVRSPLSSSDSPDLTAGLYLQHIFGDGGRRQADIDALRARAIAARDDLEDARRQGRASYEGAVASYRALIATQAALASQIDLLATERTTLRSQLASGQANLNQLFDIEVSHYRAVNQSIVTEAELLATGLRVQAGTGSLLRRLGITTP
jgi:outer membrane protein TolC